MKSKFLSKVKEKPHQTNVLYDVNKDIDKKKTTGIKDGSIICKEKVNRQFVIVILGCFWGVLETFERAIQRKYSFSPFLFKVATSCKEEAGRPVIMFGWDEHFDVCTIIHHFLFRYPSYRKELTFLFGREMCQEEIVAELRRVISSAHGCRETHSKSSFFTSL